MVSGSCTDCRYQKDPLLQHGPPTLLWSSVAGQTMTAATWSLAGAHIMEIHMTSSMGEGLYYFGVFFNFFNTLKFLLCIYFICLARVLGWVVVSASLGRQVRT